MRRRAGGPHRRHVLDHEARTRQRRQPCLVDPQVLRRHAVAHAVHEVVDRQFHQRDRDPLAGAAVAAGVGAATLRDQIERPRLALQEAVGIEYLGCGPVPLVVPGAVQIEHHALAGAQRQAVDLQIVARARIVAGKNGVPAPHLLNEAAHRAGIGVVGGPCRQPVTPVRMHVQRVRGEHDVDRHCHRRADQVEQFDCGDARW